MAGGKAIEFRHLKSIVFVHSINIEILKSENKKYQILSEIVENSFPGCCIFPISIS